jgi:hypothetical protein
VPFFMDHHRHVEGLTADAVADAHRKDEEIQDQYGVRYHRIGSTRVPGRPFAWSKLTTKRRPKPFIGRATGFWPTR